MAGFDSVIVISFSIFKRRCVVDKPHVGGVLAVRVFERGKGLIKCIYRRVQRVSFADAGWYQLNKHKRTVSTFTSQVWSKISSTDRDCNRRSTAQGYKLETDSWTRLQPRYRTWSCIFRLLQSCQHTSLSSASSTSDYSFARPRDRMVSTMRINGRCSTV